MSIKSRLGFTLVEIMIVLVIIGLLATMAFPALQRVREASMEKALNNELRQLALAADQYFIEYGVTSAGIDSLVGTDKYINSQDRNAFGNASYPDTIIEGSPIVISNTPIGDVSVDF